MRDTAATMAGGCACLSAIVRRAASSPHDDHRRTGARAKWTCPGRRASAARLRRRQHERVARRACRRVADANARRLGLDNVRVVRADWYEGLETDRQTFDMIVSTPPYIAAGDRHLGQGDLRFEPMAALTPGGDGLSALGTIIAGAPARLVGGGYLIVEHGYDQRDAVDTLFEKAGFTNRESTRDLAGIPRVFAGMLADAA